LSVGIAPCGFAAGTTGALPQAGAGAAPCNRRQNSAAAPISATIRAKIAEKLMSFPLLPSLYRAHPIRRQRALKPSWLCRKSRTALRDIEKSKGPGRSVRGLCLMT
jgi:hypothetical protein